MALITSSVRRIFIVSLVSIIVIVTIFAQPGKIDANGLEIANCIANITLKD